MTARIGAGRRIRMQSFPYSIYAPAASNNSLLAGTAGVPCYAFERTQPFTIIFTINPITIPANGNIFSEAGTSAPNRGIVIRHSSTVLAVRLVSGSGGGEASMNFPIAPVGRPTKVAVRYAGNSLASGIRVRFGKEDQVGVVSLNNLTGTIVEAGVTTRWAAFSSGSLGPNAYLIPEVVADYEFSDAQLDDYFYDGKITGATPLDQYPCSEGSGPTIASIGSRANALTLVTSGGTPLAWSSLFPGAKARTQISQPRIPLS